MGIIHVRCVKGIHAHGILHAARAFENNLSFGAIGTCVLLLKGGGAAARVMPGPPSGPCSGGHRGWRAPVTHTLMAVTYKTANAKQPPIVWN